MTDDLLHSHHNLRDNVVISFCHMERSCLFSATDIVYFHSHHLAASRGVDFLPKRPLTLDLEILRAASRVCRMGSVGGLLSVTLYITKCASCRMCIHPHLAPHKSGELASIEKVQHRMLQPEERAAALIAGTVPLLTCVHVVLRAAAHGKLLGAEHVAALIDAFVDDSVRLRLQDAAGTRDLRLLQRVGSRTDATPSDVDAAMCMAANRGYLDVIEAIHAMMPPTMVVSAYVMDNAARRGFLDIVKWLHEHRNEGCTTKAMDAAAGRGHLDVVKYLHNNRTEGCTKAAMDVAAARGYFQVVKWLSENRTEGCTTDAMDMAAHSGHLDVIRWLHEHRSEGCTVEAMNAAAREGYLHVVRWLFNNRRENDPVYAYRLAALHGHNDIVKWIRKRLK